MLVEQRRSRYTRSPRAVELHGRTHGLLAAMRSLDGNDQSQVPHLRVLHDLIDAMNRRERHVGPVRQKCR